MLKRYLTRLYGSYFNIYVDNKNGIKSNEYFEMKKEELSKLDEHIAVYNTCREHITDLLQEKLIKSHYDNYFKIWK